jgi:hypothetical protein
MAPGPHPGGDRLGEPGSTLLACAAVPQYVAVCIGKTGLIARTRCLPPFKRKMIIAIMRCPVHVSLEALRGLSVVIARDRRRPRCRPGRIRVAQPRRRCCQEAPGVNVDAVADSGAPSIAGRMWRRTPCSWGTGSAGPACQRQGDRRGQDGPHRAGRVLQLRRGGSGARRCDNRTQHDVVRPNQHAWHAEGQGFESP